MHLNVIGAFITIILLSIISFLHLLNSHPKKVELISVYTHIPNVNLK